MESSPQTTVVSRWVIRLLACWKCAGVITLPHHPEMFRSTKWCYMESHMWQWGKHWVGLRLVHNGYDLPYRGKHKRLTFSCQDPNKVYRLLILCWLRVTIVLSRWIRSLRLSSSRILKCSFGVPSQRKLGKYYCFLFPCLLTVTDIIWLFDLYHYTSLFLDFFTNSFWIEIFESKHFDQCVTIIDSLFDNSLFSSHPPFRTYKFQTSLMTDDSIFLLQSHLFSV